MGGAAGYAAERGVRLIGDIPIYVAAGGADHAAHPELFSPASWPACRRTRSPDGQLWGNPLYDWPAMRRDGYRWWIERFRRTFELVDLTRVDHFRGFVAYWAVRARQPDCASGPLAARPGRGLFAPPQASWARSPLIAEDLGVITPPVVRLRRELGLPGMVVLQFALRGGPPNPHRPENHRRRRRLHRHARQRHRARLVASRCPTSGAPTTGSTRPTRPGR